MSVLNKKLIRDAAGSPIPQFFDVEQGIFIAETGGTGDATDVNFTKIKMIRDALGSPIPQYFDVTQNKFVAKTSEGGGGGSGSTAWSDITGKPSSYPPSAHTHEIEEVNGLQGALTAKANDTDLTALEQTVTTHLDKKATDVVRPHGMGSIASKNYETGIFTPYLIGPEGLQYLSEGHYVKIDRLVSYSLKLIVTNKPPGAFALILYGLPYVIGNADAVGSIKVKNMNRHFTNFTPVTQSGQTAVRITSLIVSGEEISHEGIYESAVYANSELIITGTYYTN